MVETFSAAMNHLQTALEKLDCGNAPPHIGALVQMAVDQLGRVVDEKRATQSGEEELASFTK